MTPAERRLETRFHLGLWGMTAAELDKFEEMGHLPDRGPTWTVATLPAVLPLWTELRRAVQELRAQKGPA